MKKLIVISVLLLLSTATWAQAGTLTISGAKAESGAIGAGGKVLLTCQVVHSDGPANIARVAAMVSIGNLNTSYLMLYDDGTNGDMVADDGIYSLEITAPDTVGEAKIVFSAADTEKNEIESSAISLIIESAY